MSPKRDVSHIFNKFAGREVNLTEEPVTIRGKTYTQVKLADENDPVLKEMRDAAQKNGLKLRVWWPGRMGTMDFRTDRVNAHVEKDADGKWRVTKRFNIG